MQLGTGTIAWRLINEEILLRFTKERKFDNEYILYFLMSRPKLSMVAVISGENKDTNCPTFFFIMVMLNLSFRHV